MNTYSHYIITAYLNRRRKQLEENGGTAAAQGMKLPPVNSKAFLLGSVLPDFMLIFISAAVIGYNRLFSSSEIARENIGYFFSYMYFHDWRIIAAHSMFHAPLIILGLYFLGWWGHKRQRPWGQTLIWFALACGLHSAIDILTHFDDGPVLFFPFNWSYRFSSPVSYWDPNNYGNIFAPLEHLLDLGLIIYLVRDWRRRRKLAQAEPQMAPHTAD